MVVLWPDPSIEWHSSDKVTCDCSQHPSFGNNSGFPKGVCANPSILNTAKGSDQEPQVASGNVCLKHN